MQKHYHKRYRHADTVSEDLRNCSKVFKKCQKKFDCLVNEMLLIKQWRQDVAETSDSFIASFCLYIIGYYQCVATINVG